MLALDPSFLTLSHSHTLTLSHSLSLTHSLRHGQHREGDGAEREFARTHDLRCAAGHPTLRTASLIEECGFAVWGSRFRGEDLGFRVEGCEARAPFCSSRSVLSSCSSSRETSATLDPAWSILIFLSAAGTPGYREPWVSHTWWPESLSLSDPTSSLAVASRLIMRCTCFPRQSFVSLGAALCRPV
jgi:hypothetical protein